MNRCGRKVVGDLIDLNLEGISNERRNILSDSKLFRMQIYPYQKQCVKQ